MRIHRFLFCCAATVVLGWAGVPSLVAQAPAREEFPGIKGALTPEQYSSSGLKKLSADERAKLDAYLKDYFSGASQRVAAQAASQAVDQAVKEKRVGAPTTFESKLVGTFTGWTPRTVFVLENGDRWRVVDESRGSYAPVVNPPVLLARDSFGYKMAISGGGIMRVSKR